MAAKKRRLCESEQVANETAQLQFRQGNLQLPLQLARSRQMQLFPGAQSSGATRPVLPQPQVVHTTQENVTTFFGGSAGGHDAAKAPPPPGLRDSWAQRPAPQAAPQAAPQEVQPAVPAVAVAEPAVPAPSSARAAAGHASPPSGVEPPRKPRRRGRRRAKKASQVRAGLEDADVEMRPATLSLTAPPFVPGALELDDAWADSARRTSPAGASEALRPQRKLQRVRTSSRSPRGSDVDDDDLTEESFDAGMAAAATAAATASADALLVALEAPPPGWLKPGAAAAASTAAAAACGASRLQPVPEEAER